MKNALLLALLLAGCAAPAVRQEPVRTVALDTLTSQIVIGTTRREQARALAEPHQRIAFDSGYEAWLYLFPAGEQVGEFVVLFDPSGIVRKTRRHVGGIEQDHIRRHPLASY